ncbi:MAG: tRNA (adenosine(37)-N6)-threonylcarbamoyltransferase complex dimerization subunit type 1 TsaB [Acidobacteriia bacterium]|nr:tRNA (adenosine(37)-N6)-threonylcarbamoyltransferase complex dimerization subunit type 1 TsaB [Terriglobia bacterium]
MPQNEIGWNRQILQGLAAQLPYNRLVLTLALDTSSPCGSLAVLRNQSVIGSISTWTDEAYSSRIFRHLEFLLGEVAVGLDAFDLFAVVAGPGSFTGLRVGLAAVKGWAEVYGKPIAAISALEAVAAQVRSTAPVVIPVLDARRGQVYFGIYRRAGAPEQPRLVLEGDERVATPEEFAAELRTRNLLHSGLVIATPAPEIVSSVMTHREGAGESAAAIPVDRVSAILAPHVGQLGYLHAQRGELTDALTLDANYIRRSDAEMHLKGPRGS